MSKYNTLHEEYEACIREAIKRGSLVIECGSLSEARRTRVGFYNYMRYLNGVIVGTKGSVSDRLKASEIKELADRLIMRADKAGILELKVRSALKDGVKFRLALEKQEDEKLRPKSEIDAELAREETLITQQRLKDEERKEEERKKRMTMDDIISDINRGE